MDLAKSDEIKQVEIRLIHETAQAYLGYVNDIIMSLNAEEARAFTAAIAGLVTEGDRARQIIKSLPTGVPKILDAGYALYQVYDQIAANVAQIHTTVSNATYSRMALYNFSGSTVNTIVVTRNRALELTERYEEVAMDTDTNILKELMRRVDFRTKTADVLLFLLAEHATNRFTVELIRGALEFTSGNNRERLLDIIEREKDRILGATRRTYAMPGIQGTIVRCSLVPATISMEWSDLMKLLEGSELPGKHGGAVRTPKGTKSAKSTKSRKSSKSRGALPTGTSPVESVPVVIESTPNKTAMTSRAIARSLADAARIAKGKTAVAVAEGTIVRADDFAAFAAINGLQVVVINMGSRSAVDFNINGLISMEYVERNNIKTRINSCLNRKVLQRFETVRELPRAETQPGVIQHFGGGDHAIVFETLNGQLYKVLTTDVDRYTVRAAAIQPLLHGFTDRMTKYARMHEVDILARCFDPKTDAILESYAKDAQSLPVETIKRELAEKLHEMFEGQYVLAVPKSVQEFRVGFDKDLVASAMMGVFLKHIAYVQDAEYAISYIVKFDDIIRTFYKEMETAARRARVTDLTFRERSPADLRRYLLEIVDDICRQIFAEFDRTRKFSDIELSIKEFYMEHKLI